MQCSVHTFCSHGFLNASMGITNIRDHHRLWTPNEGIDQRNLKIWADVADKICFGRTRRFGSGSGFSAVQWRRFPHRASVVRGDHNSPLLLGNLNYCPFHFGDKKFMNSNWILIRLKDEKYKRAFNNYVENIRGWVHGGHKVQYSSKNHMCNFKNTLDPLCIFIALSV